MKQFKVIQGNIIPPIATEGFNQQYNLSDYYFAKVKTVGGDISKSTVRYDHDRKRWLFGGSGINEVIEYYDEIPSQ